MSNSDALPSAPRLRVLVVDDNADSADTLAMLLGGWGHDTQVAYNGSKALQYAQAAPPAAVLSDIRMPEMNGYDLARHLRQDVHLQQTILIAITGYGSDESRSLSRAAGFDYHFTKPVEPDVLQELLEMIGQKQSCGDTEDHKFSGQ